LLRSLQRALDPSAPTNPDSAALPWLVDIIEALELSAIAAQHPDKQSSSALASLIDACGSHQLTVQDLAATVEVLGKVVLTNYHTAKGREFDTVILPGW
jgi:DNA helicase-2/ATP-dependent DNA helicase PcrA